MMITKTSPLSGEEHTMEIDVSKTAIYAWKCGELIQVAMPDITPEEREFIQTGYTPSDWKKMFPPEEPKIDEDDYAGTRL